MAADLVPAIEEARRDLTECVRQLRVAATSKDPAAIARAIELAVVSVLDADIEMMWCLDRLDVPAERTTGAAS